MNWQDDDPPPEPIDYSAKILGGLFLMLISYVTGHLLGAAFWPHWVP